MLCVGFDASHVDNMPGGSFFSFPKQEQSVCENQLSVFAIWWMLIFIVFRNSSLFCFFPKGITMVHSKLVCTDLTPIFVNQFTLNDYQLVAKAIINSLRQGGLKFALIVRS